MLNATFPGSFPHPMAFRKSLLVLTHICANRFRMDQHNLQNVIINEKYLIFYDSDGMENS